MNTGRKARLGLSGLVIAGVAAAALAAVSHAGASSSAQAALSGPQPGAPLDHFVCYHVRQAAGSPPIPASVLLGDEFSAKNPDGSPIPTPVKVGAPTALCAPITKYHQVGSTLYVYPVVHPTLHLVCFKITESTPTPRMFVSTDNQFNPPGQKRILQTGLPGTNVTAQSVCLPSHKSVDPAAPPQGEPLGLLSHFKCYTADRDGAHRPDGARATGQGLGPGPVLADADPADQRQQGDQPVQPGRQGRARAESEDVPGGQSRPAPRLLLDQRRSDDGEQVRHG